MSIDTPLWAALGRPCADEFVPPARSPRWRAATSALRSSLADAGCHLAFRSWQSLWAALHDTSPPAAVTWGALVGTASLSDLIEFIPVHSARGLPCLTYWNLRWLCDPFTAIATSKKSVLTEALKRRRIVTIVETHWDATTVARWEGTFPTATVRAVSARSAPAPGNGGPQGGTAIILPPGATFHSSSTLIPGCVQAALISLTTDAPPFYLIVVYLPPPHRLEVLAELVRHTTWDHPVYVAGDFNFDLRLPRNDDEFVLAGMLNEWLAQIGSARLPTAACTRRLNGQAATLDGIAVPVSGMWKWALAINWHPGCSDHASLTISPTGIATPAARACTPHAINSLPPEAIAHLRRLFGSLRIHFEIPELSVSPAPPLGWACCMFSMFATHSPLSTWNCLC